MVENNGANGTEHKDVKEYYGEVLKSNKDLKTNACCTSDALSDEVKGALSEIHPDIINRFYGCGSPIPPLVKGLTVLDLGCGTGRDSFVLSKLVGASGRVIGVDMTEAQIKVAECHLDHQMSAFGYSEPNIEFKLGNIEDLAALGIKDNSVDLIVSNCVINLSPNKEKVFSEIFRVLRPGGELFFSDIFADRRIDPKLATDPVLRGECLGGALYIQDFRRLLVKLGFNDYRVVSSRDISIGNKELEKNIGNVHFSSLTIRAFKLDLEDRCEDYGQVAYYLGTIPGSPHCFTLDDHHLFNRNQPHLVCANTASMLQNTRFKNHFKVIGEQLRHFGIFKCDESLAGSRSQQVRSAKKSDSACC